MRSKPKENVPIKGAIDLPTRWKFIKNFLFLASTSNRPAATTYIDLCAKKPHKTPKQWWILNWRRDHARKEYLLIRWIWFWANFPSSSATSLYHPPSKTASPVPGNSILFLTIIIPGINWNLSDTALLCHIIHGLAYRVFVSDRIDRSF